MSQPFNDASNTPAIAANVVSREGKPTRGTLKVVVETSKPITRAGETFAIFVRIENPYEVPIIIKTVETYMPTIIRDVFGEYLQQKAQQRERDEQIDKLESVYNKILLRLYFLWHDLTNIFQKRMVSPIAQAYTTKEIDLKSPKFSASQSAVAGKSITGLYQIAADMVINLDSSVTPEEFHNYVHALNILQKSPVEPDEILLNPGDTAVKQFLLETRGWRRGWLFFTPLKHRLAIQLRYLVEGDTHHQTVPYDLDIRASITATAIGGAVGGAIGVLVRTPDISSWTSTPVLFPAIISAILSIMTVVALARKSDAQPLVSIEDFLGGLLLGFAVGYTGNELFNQVIEGVGVGTDSAP
jgi:hypothetical protein